MKAAAAFLIAVAAVTIAPRATGAEERLVKIAGLGAMDGVDRVFGTNARIALQMATEEINRAGGVKLADGAIGKIQLSYFNQRDKPEDAIDIVRTLASEDWLAAIGPTCSLIAEPLFGVLQRRVGDSGDAGLRFPILNDAAMTGQLGRISDWAFRNTADETAMYAHLFRWIKAKYPEAKTIAGGAESDFFHSRVVWGEIKTLAKGLGYKVVADEQWTVKDRDFTKPVAAWRRAKPDILVIPVLPGSGCAALREIKQQELKPRAMVGLTSAATLEMLRNCGAEASGLLVPTTFYPGTPEARRLAETAAKRYAASFDLYAAAAYENLYLLRHVLEASGVEATPATVEATAWRGSRSSAGCWAP